MTLRFTNLLKFISRVKSGTWEINSTNQFSSSTEEILPYEQLVVKKRDLVLKHNLIKADHVDTLLINKTAK